VGRIVFPPPGGLLPLKSRRGRDCHGKYSPRGRNFTGKYSPGETFFGGDPIIVYRQRPGVSETGHSWVWSHNEKLPLTIIDTAQFRMYLDF